MLVFLHSIPAIFIQVGAMGSRSVVLAPPAVASYVGGMGVGCCYWFMGRSPEYFIPVR
jgi:hypothetical protein